MFAVFVAAMGLLASCGATKDSETGDSMENDTSMSPPAPDTSGTETPMPMDTMGQ